MILPSLNDEYPETIATTVNKAQQVGDQICQTDLQCAETETTTSATTTTTSQPQQLPSSPPSIPQRRLRFASAMTVHEIPNRNDYTPEEKQAYWFQQQDYRDFRQNCYTTVGLYRAGHMQCMTNDSIRGLESRLRVETAQEKERIRYFAKSTVLCEQYAQCTHAYYNPQRIADLYHAISWKAQYNAYTKAMVDEQEQEQLEQQLEQQQTVNCRRSKILGNVIDIERTSGEEPSSCAVQARTDFDVHSFFQDVVMASAY